MVRAEPQAALGRAPGRPSAPRDAGANATVRAHLIIHFTAVTGLENGMSAVPAARTTRVAAYVRMTVADLEA